MSDIFKKLAEKVKCKEIRQIDIAKELEISQSRVSMILRGEGKPSKTLTKLAEMIYGELKTEHPDKQIQAMIKMVEDMDQDTKKSALDCIEKEKWIAELKKERKAMKAA